MSRGGNTKVRGGRDWEEVGDERQHPACANELTIIIRMASACDGASAM